MKFKYLTIYKFKKFIKKCNIIDNLNYDHLSYNQNAINFLSKNKDKINWSNISLNPKAIPILYLNKNKINWNNVALNINAYKFILDNINYIDKRKILINESNKLFYFTTNIIIQKTLFINSYYNTENKKWDCICQNPFLFYKFKLTII